MNFQMLQYHKVVNEVINKHNFNIKTDFSNKQTILMAYDSEKNTILINPMALNDYINDNLHPTLNDKEIIEMLTYHELGHYIDSQQNDEILRLSIWFKNNGTEEEYNQYVYEREKQAWLKGAELIPSNLQEEYNRYNYANLIFWKSKIEENINEKTCNIKQM